MKKRYALLNNVIGAAQKIASFLHYRLRRLLLGILAFILSPKISKNEKMMLGSTPAAYFNKNSGKTADCAVLFCPGGGFNVGSFSYAKLVCSHLLRHIDADFFAFSYRLAPAHPYPAALQDGMSAFEKLVELGYPPNRIVILGISAGGNLALSIARELQKEKQVLPLAVVCMSPWSDLTLSGESIITLKKRDNSLRASYLRKAAKAYAANMALDDPAVSPLFADYTNFCPVLIQAGSEEILLSDSVRLYDRISAAGTAAKLHVFEHQSHGFQSYSSPDSYTALAEVNKFIQDLLLIQNGKEVEKNANRNS